MNMALMTLKQFSIQAFTKFLTVAWCFWFRRNKWTQDKELRHPSVAMEHSLAILDLFQEMKRGDHVNRPKDETWHRPMVNYLKLNVDGALFVDQRQATIGMVVRNDRG